MKKHVHDKMHTVKHHVNYSTTIASFMCDDAVFLFLFALTALRFALLLIALLLLGDFMAVCMVFNGI